MTTLSRVLLAALLMSIAACGGPQDPSVISRAQATEGMPALYPPISADAVEDGAVHDYY